MHVHQRRTLLIFLALLGRAFPRFGNRNPAFFRDGAHRFRERRLLELHHKLKNIAALAAAKAVIHLLHRAHAERRSFFLMERTQPAEILPTLLQTHVFANHANNVRLLLNPIRETPRLSHSIPAQSTLISARGGALQHSFPTKRHSSPWISVFNLRRFGSAALSPVSRCLPLMLLGIPRCLDAHCDLF